MIEADRRRVKDLLRYATDAVEFLGDGDAAALEADEKTLMAIVGALILLGEGAAQISSGLKASLPHMPWRQAKDLRNLLVHRYFEVEAERLVETVRDHLPKLITDLQALLTEDRTA